MFELQTTAAFASMSSALPASDSETVTSTPPCCDSMAPLSVPSVREVAAVPLSEATEATGVEEMQLASDGCGGFELLAMLGEAHADNAVEVDNSGVGVCDDNDGEELATPGGSNEDASPSQLSSADVACFAQEMRLLCESLAAPETTSFPVGHQVSVVVICDLGSLLEGG